MNQLDPQRIQSLKTMAAEGRSIAEMVNSARSANGSSVLHAVEVLSYFREAFGLTLAQVKPIADWLAYGGGEAAESALHDLVWPGIEWRREYWTGTAAE